MLTQFFSWYLAVQLVSLAALPLTLATFANLPDRGYAFSKSLGIFLVGFTLWIGTSYGLLRNEAGGAWLAVAIVAAVSAISGRNLLRQIWLSLSNRKANEKSAPLSTRGEGLGVRLSYVLAIELLFLLAFAAWAYVRAHDPAIAHTEQPMDLMFMNGIAASPTYPPQDPWLAGYAISYYYLGYWFLVTLSHLAAEPLEIAYNLGQASWYGLLLVGAFGIVFNLLASRRAEPALSRVEGETGSEEGSREASEVDEPPERSHQPINFLSASFGGLLAAVAVGVIGNLHGVRAWLGIIGRLPGTAALDGPWYTHFGFWQANGAGWAASRVISDIRLDGSHSEVIDEFPIFSYVLGDNHPHVLAMPFVILAIALAFNLLRTRIARQERLSEPGTFTFGHPSIGPGTLLLAAIIIGGLVPLNTWDFPPYLFLFALCFGIVNLRVGGWRSGLLATVGAGILLTVAAVVIYLPYLLTAQSQASGLAPNLLNPTRLPQFLLMFAPFLLGALTLIALAWRSARGASPSARQITLTALAVFGLPLLFLAGSTLLAANPEAAPAFLNLPGLPEGATSYLPFITDRWLTQGGIATLLLVGTLLIILISILWQRLDQLTSSNAPLTIDHSSLFTLLLATTALLLIFGAEFVYVRDFFNSRMNTVFKFYYQAWLLLGLSSAYAIALAAQQLLTRRRRTADEAISTTHYALPATLAAATLVLILLGLFYPIGAIYGKTNGFASSAPTFDATSHMSAAERDAIAWVRENTSTDDIIAEVEGNSYGWEKNRVSTATGRPTLLGWRGHQSQWRGDDFNNMVAGRPEALEQIYRAARPNELAEIANQWGVDYLYVGPVEREKYAIVSAREAQFAQALDLVFEAEAGAPGQVRIYAVPPAEPPVAGAPQP